MYLIQYTPLMISVGGAYFSPLFILVLCFASHENDFRSMIFGLICGMLTDLNSLTVPGYHAVLYMLFALVVRFLTLHVSVVPLITNLFGTKLLQL